MSIPKKNTDIILFSITYWLPNFWKPTEGPVIWECAFVLYVLYYYLILFQAFTALDHQLPTEFLTIFVWYINMKKKYNTLHIFCLRIEITILYTIDEKSFYFFYRTYGENKKIWRVFLHLVEKKQANFHIPNPNPPMK